MPRLLDVTEVATNLKVKSPTIYAWVDQGKLPHIRIGRLIRFTPEQIDQFLRTSSRGPGELPLDDRGERSPESDQLHLPLDDRGHCSEPEDARPHLDGGEDPHDEERWTMPGNLHWIRIDHVIEFTRQEIADFGYSDEGGQ